MFHNIFAKLWAPFLLTPGPQKATGDGKGSSRVNYGRVSRAHGPPIEPDDDSHSKFYSESRRHQNYERDIEDSEVSDKTVKVLLS